MKLYFYLLVGVHGLFVSDSPCISVPSQCEHCVDFCCYLKTAVDACLSYVLETETGEPVAGMLVRPGRSSGEYAVSLVWCHLFRDISIVWYVKSPVYRYSIYLLLIP